MWLIEGVMRRLLLSGLQCSFFPAIGGGSSSIDIGDNIANSIMLDSSLGQNLSRTFGTPTNNKIFTIRRRIKRAQLGTRQTIIGTCDAGVTSWWNLSFLANNTIQLTDTNCAGLDCFYTTAVFDDPTAWLDIVLGYDTTQAIPANRVSLEVNGVTISSFSVFVAPPQNSNPRFNSAVPHYIGKHGDYSGYTFYGDYYDASNFIIDGQKLPASNWGRFSADTGQWVNKTYTGTYGNNGSKLEYATAAALGTDTSGNGNHWTPNGGITSANQYTDTPTNNFCVLNPLAKNLSTTKLVSKGNLTYVYDGATEGNCVQGSIGTNSGKFYFETKTSGSTPWILNVGLCREGFNQQAVNPGGTSSSIGFYGNGKVINYNGSPLLSLGGTFATNDVIGIAFDADTGKVWFAVNNVWVNSGNPSAGTGYVMTGFTGRIVPVIGGGSSGYAGQVVASFGATQFAYTPPTGFKALSTANIPEGTAAAPETFTGTATNPGPFIWMNGCPETATINGNAVVWGTHALRCAGGMQIITSSASYNASGSNTLSCTFLTPNRKSVFKYQTAKGN